MIFTEDRRSGVLTKTRAFYADPGPEDAWAPVSFAPVCVDPNGYQRREHSFCVDTRRGPACCWCGRIQKGR